MKKHILIIAGLSLGVALYAQPASPTAQAVEMQSATNALSNDWNIKIAAAKAAKDSAAVATLAAQRNEALRAKYVENAAAVANLVPDLDEIIDNNPGIAAWVIKRHLNDRNSIDGATSKVFEQNSDDRALAARLLEIGNGSNAYYYYQYYATSAELNALSGSSSHATVSAVAKRARDLGIFNEVMPAYYQKCLGLGLVHNGYNTWFNQKVRSLWQSDRAAALKLLEDEQAGIGTQSSQSTIVKARLEQLRELSARFAEIIARG